jgi:hypothetical protein
MLGRLTMAGSFLAVLLFPAAASAVTYTVDPGAAAGCAATNVCKTITDANAKVVDGDTVSIQAGSYQEPTIAVLKKSVTFLAADAGKVSVSTSTTTAGAATFALGDGSGAGQGTVLRGLTVGVPATGGPAVLVKAAGTLVDGAILQRQGATGDEPVYSVDDTGLAIASGTNTIKGSFVLQLSAPQPAGNAPGVRGGGKTSLVLEDTIVVSGDKAGPGVVFNGNDRAPSGDMAAIPNRITRGTILTLKPAANAVEVLSGEASAVPKATVLDSVILSPGTEGAGVRAASAGAALTGSTAGDIAVTARHVTVAGGGRPFALDAAALSAPFLPAPLGTPAPAVGKVAVTAERSIVHGAAASTVTASTSTSTQTGSTDRLTIKDSDTTDAAGGTAAAGTAVSGATTTADGALFRNLAARDLHLKASAPVIDKGGAQAAGESDKDFEGQPRVTGAASDLGADEYVNSPPVATLRADRTQIKQGETVAFDAAGSTDIDGPITRFAFVFGDGSPTAESSTGKVSHQFTKAGTFNVLVGALDGAGAGGLAQVTVQVTDGTAPAVAIASPKGGAKIKLFNVKVRRKALKPVRGRERTRTTRTTTLRKVLFTGTASDEAGVRLVELSLRRVRVTKSKARVGTTTKTVTAKRNTAKAAQATSCTFLDPKAKKFVGRACSKPIFFTVAFTKGKFSFKLNKNVAYRRGDYVLSARATDVGGVVSVPVTAAFTLR